MRLADAVRTDQAEAALHVGKPLGEFSYLRRGVGQLLVGIDLEVVEGAVAIARRDARVFEQPARVLFALAVAANHATNAVGFKRFPTSGVALLARREECGL